MLKTCVSCGIEKDTTQFTPKRPLTSWSMSEFNPNNNSDEEV